MAAVAVTKLPWCNPSLFLFAAGHFVEFASVMLGADNRVPRHRRLQLVLNVESAIEPAPLRRGREELIRHHLELGHDELSARRATDWDLTMEPKARDDRHVWSLSGSEAETLRAAWIAFAQAEPDLTKPAIAACFLAANGRVGKDGPNLSLAARARVATEAIAASLIST
jgi:hypothetical protein